MRNTGRSVGEIVHKMQKSIADRKGAR